MDTEQIRQAAKAQREKTEQDYKNRAAECMANHRYVCLVKQKDLEVWRCKAPGTTAYAFDIMMTRFGIAVVGDIDNLTFSVGLGYGMEFLSGEDVMYYIHSKLSERCKERTFSEDLFRQVLMRHIAMALHSECCEEVWDTLPAWLKDADLVHAEHWHDFRRIVLEQRRNLENGDDRWMHWDDLLGETADIGSTEQAMIFMRDNSDQLCIGDEWYENRVDEPCSGLVQRLYMINHAARTILAPAD